VRTVFGASDQALAATFLSVSLISCTLSRRRPLHAGCEVGPADCVSGGQRQQHATNSLSRATNGRPRRQIKVRSLRGFQSCVRHWAGAARFTAGRGCKNSGQLLRAAQRGEADFISVIEARTGAIRPNR